jgi:hypothetical protein
VDGTENVAPEPAPSPRRPLLVWLIAVAAVLVAIAVSLTVSHGSVAPAASTSVGASTPTSTRATPRSTAPTGTSAPSVTPSASDASASPASTGVPVPPLGTLPAVTGDDSAPVQLSSGVTVSLVSVRAVTAKGTGPGELSGAGLAVTIDVRNSSKASVDLSGAGVTLYTGTAGTPGAAVLTDPSASSLPVTLAPGRSSQATYVFVAGNRAGTPVAVQVLLSPTLAPVVFQSSVGS